ncbi:MAG: serpin family protein, partial [Firmicutes bacterium]|nr:serpin family protein [Bacillota bacterium]
DEINKWISDATKGKIQKMIAPPISQDVLMYLINAIYFKGEWTEQFDKKHTFSRKFRAGNGETKKVMMMSRKGEVAYGQGDDFKAVRLPYGNGKTAMYCILPDEAASINQFIAGIDGAKWNTIKKSLSQTEDVTVQIPRFKMEYGIKNLNDSLTALGMGEAFHGSADFSGISGIRDDIFIGNVLHKAMIEVNEEGSEAAGVTVSEIQKTAIVEPITFIGDRPFVFVIADEDTGTVLFVGKLWDVDEK